MTFMTHRLHLLVSSRFRRHNQSLSFPVLQHLPHTVVCHGGALDGYGLLHRLFEGELHVQTLIDRIVPSHTTTVSTTGIITTVESVLNTVTKEV